MTTIKLATLATIGATFFAGCGMQSGEEPAGEGSQGQTTQAISKQAVEGRGEAKAAALPAGPALDVRTAAPATEQLGKGSGVGTQVTWYTGSVDPGAQQFWRLPGAGEGVYKVGLSPVGASTTAACQFQVVRTWDVQPAGGGAREFQFIIQNTGTIACGANGLLQSEAALTSWSTGGLNPGETQGTTWYNANPLGAAYYVNVVPSGSTHDNACQLEVTRSYYSGDHSGVRSFNLHITNVGSIACTGTVLLGRNMNVQSSWETGFVWFDSRPTWTWNNANPLNRIYVPGVAPRTFVAGTSCQLEVLPDRYQQVINADGTSQRQYLFGVKNVGDTPCLGTMLLNYLDG